VKFCCIDFAVLQALLHPLRRFCRIRYICKALKVGLGSRTSFVSDIVVVVMLLPQEDAHRMSDTLRKIAFSQVVRVN
jgi:hypothetical protein